MKHPARWWVNASWITRPAGPAGRRFSGSRGLCVPSLGLVQRLWGVWVWVSRRRQVRVTNWCSSSIGQILEQTKYARQGSYEACQFQETAVATLELLVTRIRILSRRMSAAAKKPTLNRASASSAAHTQLPRSCSPSSVPTRRSTPQQTFANASQRAHSRQILRDRLNRENGRKTHIVQFSHASQPASQSQRWRQ